jgi:ABC-type spermidine/putrescine transport system permease subunit II
VREATSRRVVSAWAAVTFAFLYAPLVVVVAYAFNANPRNVTDWTGATARWFGEVVRSAEIRDAVATSLTVAIPNAVLAVVLGTAAALGLRGAGRRVRAAYDALAYLTLVTPTVVIGISALLLFISAGVPRGTLTITLTHVVFNSSIVLLIVRARLSGIGSEEEEAAFDLGASRLGVLRQVTLPRLLPAMGAGALLAFTFSWDDYVIASFVTGPESTTLPIYVFSQLRFGLSPEINALGTMILAVNVLAVAGAALLVRRSGR